MAEGYAEIAIQSAEREVRRFGQRVVRGAAEMLDAEGRNFEGDTKKGLAADVERTPSAVRGVIFTNAAHGYYTHEGRDPGKAPPSNELQPFVEKKIGVEKERAPSVAFLVARKIGAEGTEGTPFLVQPFREHLPSLTSRIEGSVTTDLSSLE